MSIEDNYDVIRVIHASECAPCSMCGEPICPRCDEHYAECPCPGPHQDDEYEYIEIDWQLYAKPKNPN